MSLARIAGFLAAATAALAGPAMAQLAAIGTSPARNSMASVSSLVSVTFDRPLLTSSVTPASFRVFGRWSGNVSGTFEFSNGNRTATFVRHRPFSAGEIVSINLSHDVRGADNIPLRPAG